MQKADNTNDAKKIDDETCEETMAKDIETKEVLVPEDVNETSKEIENVPENSNGKLLENVQKGNIDEILEVEVIEEVQYQVINVGENEVVEESKTEVSFDDEDSDLENDLKREFKNEVEKLRIGMWQLI